MSLNITLLPKDSCYITVITLSTCFKEYYSTSQTAMRLGLQIQAYKIIRQARVNTRRVHASTYHPKGQIHKNPKVLCFKEMMALSGVNSMSLTRPNYILVSPQLPHSLFV